MNVTAKPEQWMSNLGAYVAVTGRNQTLFCCVFITTFEALKHSTFNTGGAHTHCVNSSILDMFTQCI